MRTFFYNFKWCVHFIEAIQKKRRLMAEAKMFYATRDTIIQAAFVNVRLNDELFPVFIQSKYLYLFHRFNETSDNSTSLCTENHNYVVYNKMMNVSKSFNAFFRLLHQNKNRYFRCHAQTIERNSIYS